jgi:hypothetical protein
MINQYDYHYKVYIDKCLALVSTMIIKSTKDARDMSNELFYRTLHRYDENDPSSWIYYKHISGEYHVTDEPIYVISVDTTERIIFNKENLKIHKNTRKEYSYGTHKYEELVARYPNKELLIKGILNPVDIETAINADDGTILSYDKRFVEINEYTLIEKLQDRIYGIMERWYQKQYNIDNTYYNITFMGILYQKLLEAVMEIRMENCLTNEAHSYHYRRFLASHGFLDFYLEHLTIKQAIILYKNIRWVERYIGQRHTQRWLIKHIMTLRSLPIAEYNVIQVYNDIVKDVESIAKFEKVSLNGLENIDNTTDTLTLKQMMDKEDPLAPFNLREREFEEKDAKNLLGSSLSSELKTKILESKAIDFTDSETHILPNMLLDFWIEMTHKKTYKAYITITHPLNGETIPLNSKNALLLYTYAVYKLNGITDPCIPDYTIGLVPNKKRPTLAQLKSVIPDTTLVSDKWLNELIETFSPIHPIINTIDFYEQVHEQFTQLNYLLDKAKTDEHLDATTYKIATVYQMYHTENVSFRTNDLKTFPQFISQLSFDEKGMLKQDWLKIATDIWKKITGLDNVNIKSLNNVHRAMIGLMTKLSSYSVHYIREINETPLIATNFRSLRIDGGNAKRTKHVTDSAFSNYATEIIDDDTVGKQDICEVSDDNGIHSDDGGIRIFVEFNIDPSVKTLDDHLTRANRINTDSFVRVGLYNWAVGDAIEGLENPLSLPALPGMQSWINMPNEMKRKIIDQFGGNLDWTEYDKDTKKAKEALDWNIRNKDLRGLDYNK